MSSTDPMDGMQQEEYEPPRQARRKNAYLPVGELMAMDEAELQALWDDIPPERQKFYESAYSSALGSLGPGDVSDDQAMGIIEQILAHYESGQVPIISGNRWVQVPTWVRDAVERGEELSATVEAADPKAKKGGKAAAGKGAAKAGAKPGTGPSPQMLVAAFGATFLFVCVAIILVQRLLKGDEELTAEMMTGTAEVMTQTAAAFVPSPTPFSITDADRVIQEGEGFDDYYPVLLEVKPHSGGSRVLIVQQKPIQIADWEYDSSTQDIASWVSGLLVRPVIGVPFSPENAQLLSGLLPGDIFLLHMSTGTVLRFNVTESIRINQQDRDIFRQFTPGIAIVMLGEQTTNNRLVVLGDYPPQQELMADETAFNPGNAPVNVETGQPATILGTDATLTVLESYANIEPEAGLPDTLAYLFVDVEITAGSQPLDTSALQFDLTDSTGTRFTPVTFDAALSNTPPLAAQLMEPGTTTQATIGFYVPRTVSSSANFGVRLGTDGDLVTYKLDYDAPSNMAPLPPDVTVANVELTTVGDKTEMIVSINVFNPGQRPVRITKDDVYIIVAANDPGDTFPLGPQVFPTLVNDSLVLETQVKPGEAVDLLAHFPSTGSKYIGIYVLGYQFVAELP